MKKYIPFILLVLLVGLSWQLTKKPVQKAEPAAITIGVRSGPSTRAPVIVLQNKKYWEQYGLDVKVVEFADDSKIRVALAANQITIGSTSFTSALPLMAQGAPVKFLAQTALGGAGYLYVRNDGSIKHVADLKGKKLGGDLGGTSTLITRIVLAENGIDPDKDVQMIQIDKALQPIALSVNKDVDAIFSGPVQAPTITKNGAIVLQDWLDKGYGDRKIGNSALVAQNDFVAKHPKEIEDFLRAYKQAFTFIDQQPDEAAQIVADYITSSSQGAVVGTQKDVLKDFKTVTYLPTIDLADLQKVADQALGAKIIDKPLIPDQIVFSQYTSLLKE